MKVCPCCKESKPFDCFHINHDRKNSYQSWCKKCKSTALKNARKQRGKKPETIRVMPTWGEAHHASKLTNADVILIRGLFEWLPVTEIAKKFEVSRTCISDIKSGKNWYRLR